ncbi:hypothetical protein Taro_001102 [Colocasia esculenta]|uniref:Uncharacterized protein n=1 Tax=Colocasia esculenta TaxID=4460 RepID=A0A843T9Z9_COLES|nr:hypothetical protein [Colocasia esculenta]
MATAVTDIASAFVDVSMVASPLAVAFSECGRIEVGTFFSSSSRPENQSFSLTPFPSGGSWSAFEVEELCLSVVGLVLLLFIMARRRCRERRVVVQTSQQEAGDAPPPPLAQPRPKDTHGGVVPPLPPQATQGFDWTPQLVGGSRAEHWQVRD